MRFEIIYTLFAAVAVAMPRGGIQQHHEEVNLPATSSMSSSMSMPMKRATPTSMATPTPSKKVTSPMRGEKRPEQMKAEKMMMLF